MRNKKLADRFYEKYTSNYKLVDSPRPRRAERDQNYFNEQKRIADSILSIENELHLEILEENLDKQDSGFQINDQKSLLIDWGYLEGGK